MYFTNMYIFRVSKSFFFEFPYLFYSKYIFPLLCVNKISDIIYKNQLNIKKLLEFCTAFTHFSSRRHAGREARNEWMKKRLRLFRGRYLKNVDTRLSLFDKIQNLFSSISGSKSQNGVKICIQVFFYHIRLGGVKNTHDFPDFRKH